MRQENGYKEEETGALGQRLSTCKGIEGRHLWRVCWVPRLQTRGQVYIIDFAEGMGVMEEVGRPGQCGSMGLAGRLPFETSESHQGFRRSVPRLDSIN